MREGRDPLALSRGCSFEKLVPDEAGRSFADFCFRRRGRGALCSPTPPRALPGAGLAGNWFSAGAGSCSGGDFVFDGWSGRVCSGRSLVFDGARRSAPLHPLGDVVREGCDPLALSRGLVWRGIGFPLVREAVPVGISFLMEWARLFWQEFGFRRRGAWGAPLPYSPSGDGCERVATLSRSPGKADGG